MLNIWHHVPVDGPYAAVALKWPDGRSCSLCGIQTELRLLWLHGGANVYDSQHPFVTPDLLSDCIDTELFCWVMRNAWKLKREGCTGPSIFCRQVWYRIFSLSRHLFNTLESLPGNPHLISPHSKLSLLFASTGNSISSGQSQIFRLSVASISFHSGF